MNKKYNFCTLFDSFYLTRGIAMAESLDENCPDYHLYIFAFDQKSYDFLVNRNMSNMTVISLEEFENERLLSVKDGRTKGEYCWTSTSSTIKYCIENFDLENCTYLDADLYFFANPSILLEEVSGGGTLITEHRYTPKYDQSKSSGKYCVQFITFHNNENGMKALDWWVDSCIDWCFARAEDGKFGDQKYLDDWMSRFDNVIELQNLGGGVAPWNVQQYDFIKSNDKLIGGKKNTGKEFDLIFYHFHALKFLQGDEIELSLYEINANIVELIYKPYIGHIEKIISELGDSRQDFIFEQATVSVGDFSLVYILKRIISEPKSLFRFLKMKLSAGNNIYHKSYFLEK